MKYIHSAFLILALLPAVGLAGSGSGIGTPPALQDTLDQLMANPSRDILRETEGGLVLGTSENLDPVLPILKGEEKLEKGILLAPAALKILNPGDAKKRVTVDAINSQNQIRSYSVEDGDKAGDLILIDRREMIRSEVKPAPGQPAGNSASVLRTN